MLPAAMADALWTKARVDALLDGRAPEGQRLEYKARLPGPSDAEKREFLKDVTSFANTAGGTLIFGIEGERDADGRTTGAPARAVGLQGWNRDQVLQRLENLLLTGVSPRIFGVRFDEVGGYAEGPALALEIARSWNGPHRVILAGGAHFYARNDGGAFSMDVNQLRQAFLGGSQRADRLREFRRERARVVNSEEPVVPLESYPKVLLHVVPLAALEESIAVDLRTVELPPPLGTSGYSNRRYSIDGLACWDGPPVGTARAYTLLFRTGAIEGAMILKLEEGSNGVRWFPVGWLERQIARTYQSYTDTLRRLGVAGPVAVMVSVIGARGIVAMTDVERRSPPIDRQLLFLPEAVIEDLDIGSEQALLPVFELLWMACGAARPT